MPRLIDADMFEAVTTKIPDGMDAESYMAGMDFVLNKIDDAPTIEPERKKGKWIKMSDADGIFYACSDCGEWHEEISNYCPNCGTRMDMKGDSDG